MMNFPTRCACSLVVFCALVQTGRAAEPVVTDPVVSAPGPGVLLHSSDDVSTLAARRTAGADTFYLYGGPDALTEGRFQLADGDTPDWGGGNGLPGGYGGGPGAWTPLDHTKKEVYWHRDTFNAKTLGSHGEGNRAMWCGVESSDPRATGWSTPPGYGNNWDDILLHESGPVSDPSVGQVVDLDFRFHHDTEPGWDFVVVEYDSAGVWVRTMQIDGTDADSTGVFVAPGRSYAEAAFRPIEYVGGDYGGETGDRIMIRVRVLSDGGWSDEDGLWDSRGAIQLDDVVLTTSEGTSTEDYEGDGPWLFAPWRPPFAGDFADVYRWASDPDPCRYHRSPVVGFIDYGQAVRNGPGVDGSTSTGGSTSEGIDYGIQGSWVVNYTGGLSGDPTVDLVNEVRSPEIPWDLPGAGDDGADVVGALLRFSVWRDLPLINGIFFYWRVRSAAVGEPWSGWTKLGSSFNYGGLPVWDDLKYDVTTLMTPGVERVQIALGCWDYSSEFGYPGTAATPAPVFDDVSFAKYRVAGCTLVSRGIDQAQGGFPPNGGIDASTAAARDALDVPFEMARDINSGDFVIDTGDSVIVDVGPVIPGTLVGDVRMVWALQTNALFEDALRAAPSRAKDENVVAGPAGSVWSGEVVAAQSTTSAGRGYSDRWFADLPDEDFLYPGDVLHYYLQATDSDGRVTTLPADTSGFGDFDPATTVFDRAFTVRGLPSLRDDAGEQPSILVVNDFGHRGGESAWLMALRELGLEEGTGFDTYTVVGPTSGVSNGIGAAGGHGATPAQLAGYETILYLGGDLTTHMLSNGDATISGNDKGDDLEVLDGWLALPGPRNLALLGDGVASALVNDSAEGAVFLATQMGVEVLGVDVAPVIGGQRAPLVVPNPSSSAGFTEPFVAYGGCLDINRFDRIQPLAGAEAAHWFTDAAGQPVTDPGAGVASVLHAGANGLTLTFPYAIQFVFEPMQRAVDGSARARLLGEVLELFGHTAIGAPVGTPPGRRPVTLSVAPNPFNPSTTIEFTAPAGARGRVAVYDLRGQLVRLLHSGEFGPTVFRWDGNDQYGASVASGVYVVRAETDGVTRTAKVALVK